MAWIKLWETYKKAKDVFIKPKLCFYYGLWRKDPCLPVWRSGPTIYLANIYGGKCRQIKDNVNYIAKTEMQTFHDGKETPVNYWETSRHKLPKGMRNWDYTWTKAYKKKLRKWGLGWLRPMYHLPTWLSFRIFNHDLYWKTKWSSYDFRYEFPPQFTVVLFGFSFSWWLKAPEMSDFYWEGILHYLYGKEPKKLKTALYGVGRWRSNKEVFWGLKRDWIKPKYQQEYDEIVESYNEDDDET